MALPTHPHTIFCTMLSAQDYTKKIDDAQVYDVAIRSDLQRAERLSRRLGNTILYKREDQQPVFSFKLRGAYNKMAQLNTEQKQAGVICASAGNHAQGVALSAQKMGIRAVIVMPTTTPTLKVDAVRYYGGEVVLQGESYSDAYQHALQLQHEQHLTFIHPFDDPEVIAGQGTIAKEIAGQLPDCGIDALDYVFVAIGGGGLISGIANYIQGAQKPAFASTQVIGVQMNDSNAMKQSVEHGSRVELDDVGLFSDGTAVKIVGEETFRINQDLVPQYIEVSTDEVCAAIKDIFEDTRTIVEPAGALSVAAIKKYIAQTGAMGKTFAAVLCGANMNFDRLRFVAERAEVGEQREALFAVTIPEERGSFRRFCELLDELPAPDGTPTKRNITEFNYRMRDGKQAHIFVGISMHSRGESAAMLQHLNAHGFSAIDLTQNELAHRHVRHMIGGNSATVCDERVLSFKFPERPGALMKFLSNMQPHWNISLFNYRNQGADYSRIMVGIQVPATDEALFQEFLASLNYKYEDETDNPVYQLFLR